LFARLKSRRKPFNSPGATTVFSWGAVETSARTLGETEDALGDRVQKTNENNSVMSNVELRAHDARLSRNAMRDKAEAPERRARV
jgi:hypothetical protein